LDQLRRESASILALVRFERAIESYSTATGIAVSAEETLPAGASERLALRTDIRPLGAQRIPVITRRTTSKINTAIRSGTIKSEFC